MSTGTAPKEDRGLERWGRNSDKSSSSGSFWNGGAYGTSPPAKSEKKVFLDKGLEGRT